MQALRMPGRRQLVTAAAFIAVGGLAQDIVAQDDRGVRRQDGAWRQATLANRYHAPLGFFPGGTDDIVGGGFSGQTGLVHLGGGKYQHFVRYAHLQK